MFPHLFLPLLTPDLRAHRANRVQNTETFIEAPTRGETPFRLAFLMVYS